MRTRISASAVLMLALLTSAATSQQTLTLEEAKKVALENNLSVLQARNNIDAANSGVLAAYGNYLPTVSGTAYWSRYQNDRPASEPVYVNGVAIETGSTGRTLSNSYYAGLSASYTLFNGLSREGTLSQAKSTATSTEQTSERTKQSIIYTVESDYLNVLRTEQLVKVNEENLKRDSDQLAKIVESNKIGSASLADVYRQQSTVATDELALINAQNDFDKAKATLLALIGMEATADVVMRDATISTEISKQEIDSLRTLNMQALYHRAIDARPDYKSYAELLDAAASGVTIARSGYIPSLTASAGYALSGSEWSSLKDYKTIHWGLTLSWDIFDGFSTNASLQSAAVKRRNAEITLAQALRDISVDVRKAMLDLDAAGKQYEVCQKGLVSATEDRKIAAEKYNLGAGTLLDLNTANASLVNAEANIVNASYSFITAKRNLDYVVGEKQY